MDKVSIRLYLGCGLLRHSVDVQVNAFYVEDFYESRLLTSGITPTQISGFLVGPRTVVEFYSDGVLYEKDGIVINKSYCHNKFHDLGCTLDENWKGYLRSFRIWNYDYYKKVHTVRYCRSDKECKSDEYCLCPNGYQQPAWCPIQKRRCMHKSKYLQSNYPRVDKYDLVDVDCLSHKLKNKFLPFNEIAEASAKCDLDMKEFFDGKPITTDTKTDKQTKLLVIAMAVLLLAYLYKNS